MFTELENYFSDALEDISSCLICVTYLSPYKLYCVSYKVEVSLSSHRHPEDLLSYRHPVDNLSYRHPVDNLSYRHQVDNLS